MARPNKPCYHPPRKCWRFSYGGRQVYYGKDIRPDERPQVGGIPRRAWDEMNRRIGEELGKAASHLDPTVFGLVQDYLQWAESEAAAGRISAAQFRCHAAHLGHFLAHPGFGQVRARELTVDQLDEFFERFREQVSPKTQAVPSPHYVHNVGRSVRAMYRWAARPVKGREPVRLVHPNPLEGYRFPGQPGAVRGYVEGDVVRRFLRWAWADARRIPATSLKRRSDRIFLLMLRFQRLTGCRPGEACGLEWAEIHPAPPPPGDPARWTPRTIVIRPEKVKTRKQTTRARKIHVSRPVARLLRALERLEGRHPEYVFTHMRGRGAESRGELDPIAGEPWPSGSAASHKVARLRLLAIAAGVDGIEAVGPRKLVAYSNRHAYASEGSSLGFTDEQIAEQLGNTPEVLRRVYAHSVDEAAAERAERIADGRRRVVGRDAKPRPPA